MTITYVSQSAVGTLAYTPSASLRRAIADLDDTQKERVIERLEVVLLETALQLNRDLDDALFIARIAEG